MMFGLVVSNGLKVPPVFIDAVLKSIPKCISVF